ncbi:TIGR01777 family oxidoreductase [Aeromicrobium sp. CF3.5]|uniref:TIGR01777 family oxidoreductase n=1 Tax=Aeromicrobium sp. CF3.5 TaxID=3373078 RepID=UPI003EE5C6C1
MKRLETAVIAGASGYIGQAVSRHLTDQGVIVRTIGRAGSDASWSDASSLRDVLEGSDLVVNLAGRSVSCRYGKKNADAILTSRIGTTAALGRALSEVRIPPSLWINASTGTIYRDSRDRAMDEHRGEIGSGFSVEVARAWEHEMETSGAPVRTIALRMAIVLGAGGGALNPFINLARLGLGGRMGPGDQVFSWVHVDDVARAVIHLYHHDEISGPVNVAAPEHVSNDAMMASVRRSMGRRRGLPTPSWLLEAGSRIIRTEAELVLKSRWVQPQVLLDSTFEFAHPTLDGALVQIAQHTRRGLLPVALG